MTHYIKVGEISFKVEIGCTDPDIVDNQCHRVPFDCARCEHCQATIDGANVGKFIDMVKIAAMAVKKEVAV